MAAISHWTSCQGVKSRMYRYRHDGKPQKVTLGRYPDLTVKAARDRRDELAAQAVGGIPAHCC
jgi:hypothetical protein